MNDECSPGEPAGPSWLAATGLIGSLVSATVGAIVLIAGLRMINRPRI
jgi:uncharacterized membrane protein YeaQ/YmgE (transglycosylase-associated protein family)